MEYFCSCIEEVSVGVNCVMVRGCLLTLVPKSVYVACLSKLCLCVRVCECDWMCVSVDVCLDVCLFLFLSFLLVAVPGKMSIPRAVLPHYVLPERKSLSVICPPYHMHTLESSLTVRQGG